MLKYVIKIITPLILSTILGLQAIAQECVTDELKDRLVAVIGDAHEIFTSGRYLESKILGRQALRIPNSFTIGKPEFVHSTISASIKDRLAKGQTNLDLMKSGKAPIGPDGKHMNLHHLFAEEPGPMAEMTQTEHLKEHRKAIHVMVDKSFRNDKAKDAAYEKFKEDYWKARAAELESSL
ncbi:MAG: HNH/ENDO VII family nuclease [Cellvibrionaceae bacterium]|nr:HNH/ENDO VII family nuclease [Cellvibrionaceae bacterium]